MQTNDPTPDSNQQIPSSQPIDTPPPTEKSPSQPNLKKKTPWFMIGLIIFLLSVTSVFAYKYYELKQQLAPTTEVTMISPSPAPSPSPITDLTTDWKIYKSEKYGFEFSYPQEYFLKEVNANYLLIKRNEDPEYNWLISINTRKDLGDDVMSDSVNSSFYDFAVNQAKLSCSADGTQVSLYCDKITKEENYMNQNGIEGYIFYLNLVTETFGETPRTSTTRGPLYILDVSEQTNTSLILFEFNDELVPTSADEQNLQKILSTFKFTN